MRRITSAVLAATVLAMIAAGSASAGKSHNVHVVKAGEASGSFEMLGSNGLDNRGMNAALAVSGKYAYIGSRIDNKGEGMEGVDVIDVSDPKAPEVVNMIDQPYENNIGETSRELRIWRSQDVLIVMNLFSNCAEIHACAPVEGDDNFRFYDISGKNGANPKFISEYKPSINPHEFYVWEDPKNPDRALLVISTPGGSSNMLVTDISDLRKKKFPEIWKGNFGAQDRLHSVALSADGKLGYLSHLEGGFLMADTSKLVYGKKPTGRLLTPPEEAPKWPEAVGPGVHSGVPLPGSKYVLVDDEVYGEALRPLDSGGCPWGWVKMIDAHDPVHMKVVSEYKLPQNDESYCDTDVPRPTSSYSAHNPTLTRHLAFVTWHSGGLQAIDLTNPLKPVQAAEFRVDPLLFVTHEDPVLSSGPDKVVAWSYPIIQNGLIYISDIRNGLQILQYHGPYEDEVSDIEFLEGNSNQGDALRLSK